jgi:hypothetical protein
MPHRPTLSTRSRSLRWHCEGCCIQSVHSMLPRADGDSRNLHPGSSQILAGRRAGAFRKLGAAPVAGTHWMGPQAEAEPAVNGAQATKDPPLSLGQRKAWCREFGVAGEVRLSSPRYDLSSTPLQTFLSIRLRYTWTWRGWGLTGMVSFP